MSEKAPGFEKYTPNRLDWLTLVLNANFQQDGPCRLYYTAGIDGKSISVVIRHYARVDKELINGSVTMAKQAVSMYAKNYGWDSWLEVKVDIEELKV